MPLQAEGNHPGWQAKARTVWRFVQFGISDAGLTILALGSLHGIAYPILNRAFGDPGGTSWPQFLLNRAFGDLGGTIWLWPQFLLNRVFGLDLGGTIWSQFLSETLLVWGFVAVVVSMASLLHYWLESRDLRELERRINEQKQKEMPLARNAA